MQPLSMALGALIGFTLGLLGGGGSILTVPIFAYVLGFAPKRAIAMSLLVVGATSLIGAVGHARAGRVNGRLALIFGAVAMSGTYAGTRLASRVSGGLQLTLFAVLMLVAAAFMFRPRPADEPAPAAEAARAPDASLRIGLTAARAFGVGLTTGLLGVGGGFLIVPALVWGGLAMRDAIGTSLLVIAMNSAVGFYGYLGQADIAWTAVTLVTLGTVPGIAVGTYAVRFVSQARLRRGFAVFLLGVAAYMLIRARP